MSGLIRQFPTKPNIAELSKLLVGLMVFLLLLFYPPPPFLTRMVVNQNNWVAPLILLVFFILLLNKNGYGWEIAQTAFVFALFAIPLIYKWQFAHTDGEIVGGLLPWSDAASYNLDAHRLANGGLLSAWSARRPLFPGFLAVLLRLTQDFMISVSILTLLNTLAVLFVVHSIRRLYGSIAAGAFLIISFEFYTRFSGTTMTEQLGFAAGNLALFFLLIGARSGSLWRTLFGLGLLTLALNARAGAFFILPALIVWLAVSFRRRTAFWRPAGSALVIVIAVFLLNLFLVKLIADPQGVPFSNYSFTLYGLASGNKGWSQVIKDHPEVLDQQVMPLAMQKIRSKPILLLQGMFGSFRDYFKTVGGAFTFVYRGPFRNQINLLLWGLVISGLVYSISRRKERLPSLALASFLGVISSIPLLPPLDANEMRVYAATIPFSTFWVVCGISALFAWGGKPIVSKEEANGSLKAGLYFHNPALFFSALIIFLAFPAPLLLKAFEHASNSPASLSQPACRLGEELLHGMKFRNTNIFIIENDAAAESYMPFVRIDDFQRAVRRTATALYPFLNEELLSLKAGDQISFSLKADNKIYSGSLWMISQFPVAAGEFHGCGRAADKHELQPYSFYYLNGVSVPVSSLTVSQENTTVTKLIRLTFGAALAAVLFLLVAGLIGFRRYWLIDFLYTAGILILILPGVFISLYAHGQLLSLPLPVQERITLQMQYAEPADGNLYILPMGINWMSQAALGASPARVYENGIQLERPNAPHRAIMEKGSGRYSVWEGYLYFSSSDNTDPRFNGRVYELEWPHPIPRGWQWVSYLVSILGVVLMVLGKRLPMIRNMLNRPNKNGIH